jgi:hypothetical protein
MEMIHKVSAMGEAHHYPSRRLLIISLATMYPMIIKRLYTLTRNMTMSSKWQDTMKLKMQQLKDYKCFKDAGIYRKDPPPQGYKKSRV